jgi:hypothetical protein
MNVPPDRNIGVHSKIREIVIPAVISVSGTIISLFPGNPNNATLPSRDSGVFLYTGWRFISGDIPYRDVWDHKPPLIYVVDALGLSLTPDSLWGVWLLQFIFIFLTFFLIYKVLDREFGIAAALAGSIALASGLLTLLEQGNVTEEYALVFQALCIWLFIRAQKQNFPVQASFWIGLCAGLAFNFKQTTIGVWIACALILFAVRIFQRRSPVPDFLSLLAGWLIPSILFVIYFASQNALRDYWEQAFLYNFIYIGKHEGIRRLIPVFFKGFLLLGQGGVLHLAALGWLAGLGYVWVNRKVTQHPLILIALVSLPIEVILISISGRSIIHYYLTPLPVMAILTGALIYTARPLLEKIPNGSFQKVNRWTPAILLLVVILFQFGQIKSYPERVRASSLNEYAPVIDYIAKNTQERDKVLIIGAESAINFLTRREAPTRYVYQYPLALLGRRPMFEEYFNQILENKPLLIVDTRGRTRLDEKLYVPLQKRSEIVRAGVQYLGENYQQVAQFGDWFVYRLSASH